MSNTIEEGISKYLLATSAVTNYVSTGIYYLHAQTQEGVITAKPFIVFWTVGNPFQRMYFGTQKNGEARMQFNIVDDEAARWLRVRKAVKNALQYQTGVVGSVTVHFHEISNTLQNYDEATKSYTFIVDTLVEYEEPA